MEKDVEKLKGKAEKLGLRVQTFHERMKMVCEHFSRDKRNSFIKPHHNPDSHLKQTADICIIITGNPKGFISCHHEKLVLIDPECPANSFAFTGVHFRVFQRISDFFF